MIDLDNNVWADGPQRSEGRSEAGGKNYYGQLGLGSVEEVNVITQIPNIKAKQVSAGYFHTVIIDLRGNVCVSGDNNDRRKFTRIPYIKAKQVSADDNHTVLIGTKINF